MGHPPVSRQQAITRIQHRWANAPAWRSIRRTYAAEDVVRLYREDDGELRAARRGAEKLCAMIDHRDPQRPPLRAILARSGGQALQGLQSGAGNLCLIDAGQLVTPSLAGNPAALIERVAHIALALHRAEQRHGCDEGRRGERAGVDYAPPLLASVADCGKSALDVYHAVRGLLEAGVAGVVIDDHPSARIGALATPTNDGDTLVQHLTAARMAADVAKSDTLLIARTSVLAEENLRGSPPALDQAIARAQHWALYADVVGLRSHRPDLQAATRFANAIRQHFPRKPLCYDGPPLLDRRLRQQLGALGYCFWLPSRIPAASLVHPRPGRGAAEDGLRRGLSC